MSFGLKIEVPTASAESGIKRVEDGLNRTTDAAGKTRDALGRFVKTGADGGAAVGKAGEDAARGLDKAKVAAEGAHGALGELIAAATAFIAVHQLEHLADGYVEVRNKINAVTDSQDNLRGVMNETFRIAQETRSSWEDLAGTFQRLANAGRGLGLSQRSLLDLTEELAMGMRLSGSTSREASMTMMELTHAFTVGTLTGREFRVMMKDAPALMHELQVASGKSGAEFAEMGKSGKFSAQTLVEWFGKAKEAISDKFGQTIPTISEGFQLIRNAAEKFFGEAGVGSGVLHKLAEVMRFIADHFETFGKVALAVGEALLGLSVIEEVIALVKMLTLAIAANPLGALLLALTVGISLLRQFGDSISTGIKVWENVPGVFVSIGDELRALWDLFKQTGAQILDFVGVAWKSLTTALGLGINTDGVRSSLSDALRFVAGFVGAMTGLFHELGEKSKEIFGALATMIASKMVDALNAVIAAVESTYNKLRSGLSNALAFKQREQAENESKSDMAQYLAKNSGKIMHNAYIQTGANLLPGQDGYTHEVSQAEIQKRYQELVAGLKKDSLEDAYGQHGLNAQGNVESKAAEFGRIAQVPLAKEAKSFLKDEVDEMENYSLRAMRDFDAKARELAAARAMDAKNHSAAGSVSNVNGIADAHVMSKEEEAAAKRAAAALEKLKNELRGIMEQTNPVTKAQEELTHAEDVLTKAVGAHLITQGQAIKALDDYKRKNADALDPAAAWVTKQLETQAALRSTAKETELAAKAQEYLNFAKEKGFIPTEAQIAQAARLAATGRAHAEQMRAEQGFAGSILGPQEAYEVQQKALGDLLEKGTINAKQYHVAIDGVRAAYLAAVPAGKMFSGGLEQAWLKAKADAESFGATVATTLVGDVDKLNEAIVSAANGGQVAWGQMVDAMIQDLERLILKQLEVAAINAAIAALTGGASAAIPGGAGGIASSSGALDGLNGTLWESAVPSAATAPTAALTTAARAAPDRKPVVVQIHNHYDQSVGVASINSRAGQQAVLNVQRANGGPARR